MSKKLDSNQFIYESNEIGHGELCNQIIVTVGFKVTKHDSDYWISSLYDQTAQKELKISEFSTKEQTEIDEALEAFFDRNYDSFLQDYLESMEDQRFTNYKNSLKYGGF
jgi:hypothetical protein